MEESALLKKIYIKEQELNLDRFEFIEGVPVWRIIRFQTRLHYLNSLVGYVANTGTVKEVGRKRLKIFSGFWRFLFKRDVNLFFTFNKLVNINGVFFDKFIDPVIEESFLRNSNYLIIDPRNYTGNYPRLHKNNTNSNEGRTLTMQVLQRVCKCLVKLLYKKKIDNLYNLIKDDFNLPEDILNTYYGLCSSFLAEYWYYSFWFRFLKLKRVFVVYRESHFGVIVACKKNKIPVMEFQHGITLDNTVSFTGKYDSRIDPDFFLTFGSYWKGEYFGITEDRTFCIGWAYGKFMENQLEHKEKYNDVMLVISSPEISDTILETVKVLSQWYPSMKYHIRLHPCENYNSEQKEKLEKIPQAEVVDNSNDSATVLPLYHYVVGENSSVLYEALSMGCNVGLLNICGLRPPIDKSGITNSFFVIETNEDYKCFIGNRRDRITPKKSFYTEFDNNKFKDFLFQQSSKII